MNLINFNYIQFFIFLKKWLKLIITKTRNNIFSQLYKIYVYLRICILYIQEKINIKSGIQLVNNKYEILHKSGTIITYFPYIIDRLFVYLKSILNFIVYYLGQCLRLCLDYIISILRNIPNTIEKQFVYLKDIQYNFIVHCLTIILNYKDGINSIIAHSLLLIYKQCVNIKNYILYILKVIIRICSLGYIFGEYENILLEAKKEFKILLCEYKKLYYIPQMLCKLDYIPEYKVAYIDTILAGCYVISLTLHLSIAKFKMEINTKIDESYCQCKGDKSKHFECNIKSSLSNYTLKSLHNILLCTDNLENLVIHYKNHIKELVYIYVEMKEYLSLLSYQPYTWKKWLILKIKNIILCNYWNIIHIILYNKNTKFLYYLLYKCYKYILWCQTL